MHVPLNRTKQFEPSLSYMMILTAVFRTTHNRVIVLLSTFDKKHAMKTTLKGLHT